MVVGGCCVFDREWCVPGKLLLASLLFEKQRRRQKDLRKKHNYGDIRNVASFPLSVLLGSSLEGERRGGMMSKEPSCLAIGLGLSVTKLLVILIFYLIRYLHSELNVYRLKASQGIGHGKC